MMFGELLYLLTAFHSTANRSQRHAHHKPRVCSDSRVPSVHASCSLQKSKFALQFSEIKSTASLQNSMENQDMQLSVDDSDFSEREVALEFE
jgi:hypothetical protein